MGVAVTGESVTTRDSNGPACSLLPPGELSDFGQAKTPVDIGRSFLVGEMLRSADEAAMAEPADEGRVARAHALTQYMRMHKVLVGKAGATRLAAIYDVLRTGTTPGELSVAGWAAAEAALMGTNKPLAERLSLFDGAAAVWAEAFHCQTAIEEERGGYDTAASHRIALDMAIVPLLQGVVQGEVTDEVCRKAFDDCLRVARSNMGHLRLARQSNASGAVGAHIGLAFECNTLLSFNRTLSPTQFAIPAMARCDSGTFYRRQTHDLVVVRQRHGVIQSATPVEVKARGRLRDRKRYQALLIGGRLHLSLSGKSKPERTFEAIAAVHSGTARPEDVAIASAATEQLNTMMRDYYAGRVLARAATKHTVTVFHDSHLVWERQKAAKKQRRLGQMALATKRAA